MGYRYETYYIEGFRRLYGKNAIHYDIRPFEHLSIANIYQYNKGMPLLLDEDKEKIKVFLDLDDGASIDESRYEWCDVYGKVNPEIGVQKNFSKMIVLGPEFGIKIDNGIHSAFWGIKNYLKSRGKTPISLPIMMRGYLYPQLRREKLSLYERPIAVKNNYVFHASTLWYSESTVAKTNRHRGDFLKACKKLGLDIEGGLFYVDNPLATKECPDYPKYKEIYKDFIYNQRLSMKDYIKKTKESVVVFNTPSVSDCHGWKLGEFLCMGKAIISTPLSRDLPGGGLIHGENIHIVNSTDDIEDAISQIVHDTAYRMKLEQNARKYYEEFTSPEAQCKRLVDFAKHIKQTKA